MSHIYKKCHTRRQSCVTQPIKWQPVDSIQQSDVFIHPKWQLIMPGIICFGKKCDVISLEKLSLMSQQLSRINGWSGSASPLKCNNCHLCQK